MITKFWYDTTSDGAGSVTTTFYESEEVMRIAAEIEEDMYCEGWGEDASSYIEIMHDGHVVIMNPKTAADLLIEVSAEYTDQEIKDKYIDRLKAMLK